MQKTWAEKLANGKKPLVKICCKAFADVPANSLMLIPTPELIRNYINDIDTGHQVTIEQMRADLAITHNAEKTCPLTTGIFLRIVAEASWEAYCKGDSINDITPFWRVINSRSPLAGKLACGKSFIMKMREQEELPD